MRMKKKNMLKKILSEMKKRKSWSDNWKRPNQG